MSAGKGDKRRPCLVPRELYALRFKLATGRITFKQYERQYKKLRAKGKIK